MIIDIWGNIVGDSRVMSYGDFSSLEMKERLKMAGGEDVTIRINSMGGEVVEGFAILNLLKEYEGKVTTEIMGMAGSIASIVFLAGEERIVNENSMLFIHEARGGRAEDLDKINENLISLYSGFMNANEAEIKDLMAKETTFVGSEIIDKGFGTAFNSNIRAVALTEYFNNIKKEPLMAMSKEEQAEFEALKAKNEELLKENAEIKAQIKSEDDIKAEVDAKVQEEQERQKAILNACVNEKQKVVAEKLIEDGCSLIDAKAKLHDDFIENKADYLKLEQKDAQEILNSQSPEVSGEGEDEVDHVKTWMNIQDLNEKQAYWNKHLKGVK